MKNLIVYYGDSPEYVEGFPKNCKRSCQGSLHLLPRKPTTVTSDEYEHIKKFHKHLRVKCIAEIKPQPTKTNQKAVEKLAKAKAKEKVKEEAKAAKEKVKEAEKVAKAKAKVKGKSSKEQDKKETKVSKR